MASRRVRASLALLATVAVAASCGGGGGGTVRGGRAVVREAAPIIGKVADALGVATDDASHLVRNVSDNTQVPFETAARDILEQADTVLVVGKTRAPVSSWVQDAMEAADATFERAIKDAYCEAAVSMALNGTVDLQELHDSLYSEWGQAIADRLWNTGPVFNAIELTKQAAAGDDAGLAVNLLAAAYCS
jgi:hypothetical protein